MSVEKVVKDEAATEKSSSKSSSQKGDEKSRREDNALREGHQFVTFFIGEEVFSFPVLSVQEIIRMPEMVRVPLSPPSLEGLANLRGTLLPVVNLRALFQDAPKEHTEDTRVVVVDVGTSVGFVVDRVSRVVTVDEEKIEGVDSIQSTVNTEVLTGVVKDVGEHAMVMMLDVKKLVAQDFISITQSDKKSTSSDSGSSSDKKSSEDELVDGDEVQLVSYVVNGQEYAFPIERVEEIVRIPDEISQVPKSAGHVLGIINLRNRLLPLVSLRRMFHFEQPDLGEHNRVVVISLDEAGTGNRSNSVGIIVDQVREVLRVPNKLADEVPVMLASGDQGIKEIQSICRLDDGKRLVSNLNVDALFEHEALKEALAMQSDESSSDRGDDHSHHDEDGDEDDNQLVVFRLQDEEFGVQIESIQEIIRIPEQLTAVPKTPSFIEGMLNLRGAVLPVVDLRQRLNLPNVERNDRQRIVVFTMGGIQTGFIVDSVLEVLKLSQRVIEDTPNLSEEQRRVMGKVANLEKQKRMILILQADQLFDEEQREAFRQAQKTAA
ncbi:chemotaxis protein CheW [Magnetococcales bacterium HHB-1]